MVWRELLDLALGEQPALLQLPPFQCRLSDGNRPCSSPCGHVCAQSYAAFKWCRKIRVAELARRSSDFVVFTWYKVVMWGKHRCYKEDELYLMLSAYKHEALMSIFQFSQ